MLAVSYNRSDKLTQNLDKIEAVRRDILIIPLSLEKELSFKWETTITRIYFSLTLSGRLIKKDSIEKILSAPFEKNLKEHKKDIASYKKSIDYIYQNWYVTQKALKADDILMLYDMSCYGKLRVSRRELEEILKYLENQEHPVIEAATAAIYMLVIRPFTEDNDRIARLTAFLMLCRQGYDFRGLFSIEEFWSQNIISINDFVKSLAAHSNITLWLEDFAQNILSYAQKIKERVYSSAYTPKRQSLLAKLTERQKAIIYAFAPDTVITNKKLQSMYHISQITASRDLQKLTTLGFLYPHGKGRAIYYTRV